MFYSCLGILAISDGAVVTWLAVAVAFPSDKPHVHELTHLVLLIILFAREYCSKQGSLIFFSSFACFPWLLCFFFDAEDNSKNPWEKTSFPVAPGRTSMDGTKIFRLASPSILRLRLSGFTLLPRLWAAVQGQSGMMTVVVGYH